MSTYMENPVSVRGGAEGGARGGEGQGEGREDQGELEFPRSILTLGERSGGG